MAGKINAGVTTGQWGDFGKFAEINNADGDQIVLGTKDNIKTGRVWGLFDKFKRTDADAAANNAIRSQLLQSLANTFGFGGLVHTGTEGRLRFDSSIVQRLKESLGDKDFEILNFNACFNLDKDGYVSTGRPLTERRITLIVNAAAGHCEGVRLNRANPKTSTDLVKARYAEIDAAGTLKGQEKALAVYFKGKYGCISSTEDLEGAFKTVCDPKADCVDREGLLDRLSESAEKNAPNGGFKIADIADMVKTIKEEGLSDLNSRLGALRDLKEAGVDCDWLLDRDGMEIDLSPRKDYDVGLVDRLNLLANQNLDSLKRSQIATLKREVKKCINVLGKLGNSQEVGAAEAKGLKDLVKILRDQVEGRLKTESADLNQDVKSFGIALNTLSRMASSKKGPYGNVTMAKAQRSINSVYSSAVDIAQKMSLLETVGTGKPTTSFKIETFPKFMKTASNSVARVPSELGSLNAGDLQTKTWSAMSQALVAVLRKVNFDSDSDAGRVREQLKQKFESNDSVGLADVFNAAKSLPDAQSANERFVAGFANTLLPGGKDRSSLKLRLGEMLGAGGIARFAPKGDVSDEELVKQLADKFSEIGGGDRVVLEKAVVAGLVEM